MTDYRLTELTELQVLEDRLNRMVSAIERENARLIANEKPDLFTEYETKQRARELERRASDEAERSSLNKELFAELMGEIEKVKREGSTD